MCVGKRLFEPIKEQGIPSGADKSPDQALSIFLASGAYLGHVPFAPGTFGSLVGIPVFLGFSRLPLWGYLISLALLLAAAIFLAGRAEAIYGRHDDPRIVIDEVTGYAVAMIGVKPGLVVVVLGFILFRAFDILKPWPCGTIDRKWSGGGGVVLDDVAAGIYAAAALQVLIYFWPVLGQTLW